MPRRVNRQARTFRLINLPLAAGGAMAATFLTGCAADGSKTADAPNAGLGTLAAADAGPTPTADEMARILEQNALDLEAIQTERALRNSNPRTEQPQDSPENTIDSSLTAAEGNDAAPTTPDTTVADPTPPTPPPAVPARTPEQRIAELTADLQIAIKERAQLSSETMPNYLAEAALDVLKAGSFDAEAFKRDNAARPALQRLSDKEVAAVAAVREVMGQLAKNPDSAANPNTVAELFAKALDGLSDSRTIRIPTFELCSRVEAFGRYTPFDSAAYLAGRTHKVIAYVELENFGYRPLRAGESTSAGDEYAVDVSLELQLYHGEGSMLAWKTPEQPVIETGRSKRRDFYLAQMIELPRTLSVGAYTLKAIARDKVGGGTAEAIVPIRIVADSKLTRSE